MRAFEVTADYVQNYVQGGRILIKHQAVALRLADMATRIEAVRALLGRAAQAVDDNAADADTLCNMVKVFASEEIIKVAQHAMELHGGNGVMLDFGVEKLFRDAAIFLHMDATVDISKMKSSSRCSRRRRENMRAWRPDMDRRERKRLKDEIDRGTLNVGIRKVEEGAYEKENRSPLVKGGGVGLGIGGTIGIAYAQSVGVFHQSPLGLFHR